ncbi:probable leucine-rich repeat receptor-like protein kinase At1g68400 [Zingiber officinale]|uniref:probable leucine-rich repeat receptor-like protein kinase At1g68400 n=1 Tax=Zingiber officinale TaxID=94328 RepID=UPI001C4C049E|nr:probable leucine-rich repeat receptor-like protein kinase At1g68400 [Zingiber officinale]
MSQMLVYFTFVVINMAGADGDDADLLSFRSSIGDGNGVLHMWEGRNPCSGSWASVTCYCGSVASVCLDTASLTGNVSFLLRLPHLCVLSLRNNALSDTLPALTHYRNARLKYLHLSHNQLTAPSTRRFLSWPPSESSTIDLPAGLLSKFPISAFDQNPGLCDSPLPDYNGRISRLAEKSPVLSPSLNSSSEHISSPRSLTKVGLIVLLAIGVGNLLVIAIGVAVIVRGEDLRLDCLLKASAEVLRKGFSGSTYKTVLEDGIIVVVKRLRAVHFSAARGGKVFDRQMRIIGRVRHPNVVSQEAFCDAHEEKLLV